MDKNEEQVPFTEEDDYGSNEPQPEGLTSSTDKEDRRAQAEPPLVAKQKQEEGSKGEAFSDGKPVVTGDSRISEIKKAIVEREMVVLDLSSPEDIAIYNSIKDEAREAPKGLVNIIELPYPPMPNPASPRGFSLIRQIEITRCNYISVDAMEAKKAENANKGAVFGSTADIDSINRKVKTKQNKNKP